MVHIVASSSWFLALVSIYLLIGNADALQCYTCYNYDCYRESLQYRTCGYGQVCTKSIVAYGVTGGPTPRKDCDEPNYCFNLRQQAERTNSLVQVCSVCDSNYCNGATTTTVIKTLPVFGLAALLISKMIV